MKSLTTRVLSTALVLFVSACTLPNAPSDPDTDPPNEPPIASGEPTITPADPVTTDALQLNGDWTVSDPEGDTASLSYQWQVSSTSAMDGFTDIGGATTTTLPFSETEKDLWFRLQATPADAHGEGVPVHTSAVLVRNSPPTIDTVPSIEPPSPTSGDDLLADLADLTTSDVDGDMPIDVQISWQRSTNPGGGVWTTIAGQVDQSLPSFVTAVGYAYRAVFFASDGTAVSPAVATDYVQIIE